MIPNNIHIIGIFYNLFKDFIGYKTLDIVRGGGGVRKYWKNQDLTENIWAIWKKRVLYHPLYPTNIQNKENIDIFGFIKS